jgi:hypothetical protein
MPGECPELATPRFLRQSTEKSGVDAVEACVASVHARRGETNAIEVTKVKIEGTRATAHVETLTQGLKGQVLILALVRDENGNWKADHRLGFARIDRRALAEGILEGLEAYVDVTPAISACVRGALDRLPRAQVEALLLHPPQAFSRGGRLFGHCVGKDPSEPKAL